jgi:hypothetical protein
MSAASAIALGIGTEEEEVTLADVVWRLKAIEDIVRPMQPMSDALAALEGTMRDQGQPQATLNIALTRVECQVQDPGCDPQLHRRLGVEEENASQRRFHSNRP